MSCLGVLAIILIPGQALRGPPREAAGDEHRLFAEANRLVNGARSEADLRQAVECYRALLARGTENGRLHYNLASAHLRLKEWGPSVLHLRRALHYLPGDPFAEATLSYARSQVGDEFPREPERKAVETLLFWHHRLSLRTRIWAALAAHALFWTLLLVRAFRLLPFHRTALAASLLLALALGGSAAVEGFGGEGEEGVLVLPEVEVRSGNGTAYDLVFARPLHGGVEVRILERRGNWAHLEFPGGVRGFTVASAVEPVAREGERN